MFLDWEAVGCYKDKWDRALRNYYKNVGKLKKAELKKTGFKPYFEACADGAKKHNYILFGIQFASECWGEKDPTRNYKMHGVATNCEKSDAASDPTQVGGPWSNFVYRAKPSMYNVHNSSAVKPRFNEPLFNELLGITNNIFRPVKSYSKNIWNRTSI